MLAGYLTAQNGRPPGKHQTAPVGRAHDSVDFQLGKMKPNLNRAWAILFARLVLGLIFFMAGVMKVFQLGPLEHARKYFLPFSDTFLPIWSLWVMGVAIQKLHRDGVKVFLTAVQPQPMKVMFESGLVNWLGENKFCADLDQALAACKQALGTPS